MLRSSSRLPHYISAFIRYCYLPRCLPARRYVCYVTLQRQYRAWTQRFPPRRRMRSLRGSPICRYIASFCLPPALTIRAAAVAAAHSLTPPFPFSASCAFSHTGILSLTRYLLPPQPPIARDVQPSTRPAAVTRQPRSRRGLSPRLLHLRAALNNALPAHNVDPRCGFGVLLSGALSLTFWIERFIRTGGVPMVVLDGAPSNAA